MPDHTALDRRHVASIRTDDARGRPIVLTGATPEALDEKLRGFIRRCAERDPSDDQGAAFLARLDSGETAAALMPEFQDWECVTCVISREDQ